MKPIIISADDFAQSAGIDAAIIALIELGRLSATSCMTLSPRWNDAAKLITDHIRQKADIGLHLDFTQYAKIIKHPLPVMIARTLAHSLSARKIRHAINIQLDYFEDALNSGPDYVDGHQHVHQLPQIRELLLDILYSRYRDKLPWLRIANPPVDDGFKAVVIKQLGARQLDSQARKIGFRCSHQLLGVYAFDGTADDYQNHLDDWFAIAQRSDGVSTLMCHPALRTTLDQVGKGHYDAIHEARINEYNVFSSGQFDQLLEKHQLIVERGRAIPQ